MILKIEELSMNAWPSLQTVIDDGWILRFADGYTRRSNSIHPIYFSNANVGDHIRECEAIYGNRKLPVIFKMTQACRPRDLDSCLIEKGYKEEARTSVQVMELNSFRGEFNSMVAFSNDLDLEWESAFLKLNKINPRFHSTHNKIIKNIIPKKCFAKIRNNENNIIACGLGVIEKKHLGLFDIVIDESFRRQGWGKMLVENMILWGKENGAAMSYLQVMKNNEPALKLYSKLGYKEEYSYWYRVKR